MAAASPYPSEGCRWITQMASYQKPSRPLSLNGFPGILEVEFLPAQPWETSPPPPVLCCLFPGRLLSSPGVSGYPLYLLFPFFALTSFFFYWSRILCNVVLISVVQRSELISCIHISTFLTSCLPSALPIVSSRALSWAPSSVAASH